MDANLLWLRRFEIPSSRARLLCISHAGAGASSFNGWANLLPEWLELVRVQLPGREDRSSEAGIGAVELVVNGLIEEVESLSDKPLAIYGHCVGALIGFELARALRRRGRVYPVGLFVSGRRPPQAERSRQLYALEEQDLLIALEEMGASSPLLSNARWRQYYIAGVRKDLEIADTYLYYDEAPFACPLTFFHGIDDPHPRVTGWEIQSDGQYDEYWLDGGHFFSKKGLSELTTLLSGKISESLKVAGGVRVPSVDALARDVFSTE